MVKIHSPLNFPWVDSNCVATIGVMYFSVRNFGCALFYFGDDSMSKELGQLFRDYREDLDLSQQEVADELHVDRSTYT